MAILQDQEEMVDLWKLRKFMDIVNPEIVQSELTVFSIKKDIAGTLDIALKIEAGKYDVNGAKGLIVPTTGIYITDLKTGNQVGAEAYAQIAAYAEAYEEMYGIPVAGGLILHTSSSNRKGIEGLGCHLKTREELKPHYDIYRHLSAVWKARNPNFGPKAFEFPTIIAKDIKDEIKRSQEGN